jgi:diketogulonate reductase-like aldo/keto reductase
MERRELGTTGVMIPEIGLGTWRYHGGTAPLLRGIELGAKFIDTAEVYGSEPVVGEAIRAQRPEVFLATKVSGQHLKYKDVLKAADSSLKRLGVNVIDLYQVHWPNSRVPIAETMRAMEELVDAGKVRFIGVSNFSRRQFEAAQAAMKKHKIVANQVEYNLIDQEIEKDIEPFYERNKITVIAYSPYAQGKVLSPKEKGYQTLSAVAAEAGRTPAQVALAWCLRHPSVVVIPKTDHVERVDDAVAASGWQLTPDQIETLSNAYS